MLPRIQCRKANNPGQSVADLGTLLRGVNFTSNLKEQLWGQF